MSSTEEMREASFSAQAAYITPSAMLRSSRTSWSIRSMISSISSSFSSRSRDNLNPEEGKSITVLLGEEAFELGLERKEVFFVDSDCLVHEFEAACDIAGSDLDETQRL